MSPEDAFRAIFPIETDAVTLALETAGASDALYWDDAGLRPRLALVVRQPARRDDGARLVHDVRAVTVLALPAAFRDDPRVPSYATAVRRVVAARLASSLEPETLTDEYWPAPDAQPLARPEFATADDLEAALAAPPGVRPRARGAHLSPRGVRPSRRRARPSSRGGRSRPRRTHGSPRGAAP